jgi:hypothetical protein
LKLKQKATPEAVLDAWRCPHCREPCRLNPAELSVDSYLIEILDSVPETVEEVVVGVDGEWALEKKKEQGNGRGKGSD